jgi:hypothetical protein
MSPIYEQDMSTIPDSGEPVSKGWHRFRIEEGEEMKSEKDNPMWRYRLVCQDEPEVGRVIVFDCSLLPNALFNLKAIYKAAGYTPGPEGHNPESVHGSEVYIKIEHKEYPVGSGDMRANIKTYNIRSVNQPLPSSSR